MGRAAHGLLAAMALAAATCIAQQRAPTFFVVTGTDGKPCAGAEVTCVASLHPIDVGEGDVQRATTDERGRARCALLVGRLYEAWAITAPVAGGNAFASVIRSRLVAGQVVEVPATDARPKRRVRLPGLGAWRVPEARTLRWLPVAGIDVWTDMPLPDGDAIDVPPSPPATACVCVLDATGQALATTTVPSTSDTAVDLPAPRRVTVRAVDRNGAPIVGATVEHSLPNGSDYAPFRPRRGAFQRTIGVTDADGALACLVPRLDVGDVALFVGKSGWAWAVQRVLSDEPMTFHLQQALTSTVRLVGGPSAGVVVSASGFPTREEAPMWPGGSRALRTSPGPDGTWTVEHANSQIDVCVRCANELPLQLRANNPMANLGVIEVDLRERVTIDAQVLDADGGLSPCAVAVGRREQGLVLWLGVLATDLAGRLRVRVPPGELVLYATTPTHHALALVDRTRRMPHELRLQPMPAMRVRVRDANGKPVPGATAELDSMTWGQPPSDPVDGAWHGVATSILRSLRTWAPADDDGAIYLPAPVVPSTKVVLVVRQGGRASRPFPLQPGETREITLD